MTGLRIIGGKARGRKLRSVPGDSTRPVTDRTKEALFNILGGDIQNATFLDLFGGTGSVGIEALSRGASFAQFLDLDRLAVQTIRSNLEATGLTGSASVKRADAFQFLESSSSQSFDYVYIAPPQYKDLWRRALQTLDQHSEWLSPDAWVIVQIHPKEYYHQDLDNLGEFDQRQYGSTLLVFFERKTG